MSLETDLTGWAGKYNATSQNTRSAPGFDGSFSLRSVNNTAATGIAGFLDKPRWVNLSSVAGTPYTASAWVSAEAVGQKLTLALRELNAAGTTVGTKSTPLTATSTGWVKITVTFVAVATGDTVGFSLITTNAPARTGFRADLLSLTAPAPAASATSAVLLIAVPPMLGLAGVLLFATMPVRRRRGGLPRRRHAR
jgi:hypothetical protein